MKLANGQDAPPELVKLLTPGNKVRVNFGGNNPNNAIYHILAIVDGDQVVCKSWGKNKQRWFYKVEDAYLFWLYYKDGNLTEA